MPLFWAMSLFWGASNYNIVTSKKNKKQKNYSYCSKIKVWVPVTLTTDHIYNNWSYLQGCTWLFTAVFRGLQLGVHEHFFSQGCSWAFTTASKLKCHGAEHLNLCKFRCDQCDKHFSWPECLKGHFFTHTGIRPFHCPIEGEHSLTVRFLLLVSELCSVLTVSSGKTLALIMVVGSWYL